MKEQGLSLTQMKKFQQYIRGEFGSKSVEARAHQKLVKITHEMDDHYEATDEEFIEKEDGIPNTIERTLVVVKDSSEFIYHLHKKLDLDIHESQIKVGFDYGGECLKVSVRYKSEVKSPDAT